MIPTDQFVSDERDKCLNGSEIINQLETNLILVDKNNFIFLETCYNRRSKVEEIITISRCLKARISAHS